ncbi:MAG: protein-ADP-ribose hydrolase [Atopococcus tabaci]|uniref:Protein-ADP-ribose hydrolase n=1 Tax=Atopococcus tabaci TaxID=269774 RepID=A0AA43RMB5_9LACT|nr:protein-ADP-ribose hydrolase [Atopococcus tabaci]
MNQKERLIYLVSYLMKENAQGEGIAIEPLLPLDENQLMTMFRGLINTRLPYPISDYFLEVQDEFLQEWHSERENNTLEDMIEVDSQIYLWQGDITSLEVDAIVNAANSEFLGCFIPNHRCIDNEIQTKGGYQIRLDVAEIRKEQGRKEPIGRAKLTPGHNLPADYIIHTVAPITLGKISAVKSYMLSDCYKSVLKLADAHQLESLAICCIGTGQFGFPQEEAADIAIQTVKSYLQENQSKLKIIFNVFEDKDLEIYKRKLKVNE